MMVVGGFLFWMMTDYKKMLQKYCDVVVVVVVSSKHVLVPCKASGLFPNATYL